MGLTTNHPLISGKTSNAPIVQALSGIPQTKPPVWFMRQAGRSLPEYRKLRSGIPMLDSCLRPELISEITLQPVRRHGVDAAVLFSDIVIPLKLAGVDVTIESGVGPVIRNPVRTLEDFKKLGYLEASDLSPISDAISIIISELDTTPLLGFGGAPFTLASYLIEGGPSKELPVSRAMMENDLELWNQILNWCAEVTIEFLRVQIYAGASAIQLFDSWAGRLSPEQYEKYAMPHSKTVMDQLSDLPVSRIHFGVGSAGILKQMRSVGATVMSVSNDISIRDAVDILGSDIPLQGNLDPELLLGNWNEIEKATEGIIEEGRLAKAHIFNLGHGVLPDTDPAVITKLVEYLHA